MRRTLAERAEFTETRSDQMRANMTGAEQRLWEILKPLEFVAQWPLQGSTKNGGPWDYIADFYFASWGKKILVEVDGSSHRKKKGRDRRRDMRLKAEGIVTLRFSNNQVLKKIDEVRARIVEEIWA